MTPIHGTGGTSTSSRASSTVAMGQRERVNGWSCPWHPLQFIAWFFLLSFGVAYYGISVAYLPKEWRAAGYIIPGGIYVIHIIYHLLALTIDPADDNIRGGPFREKAIFDRSQHRHVIENSHCYICQSQVGPHSKHCSVCNKCVSGFDHHCKWLNNCVGDRNYKLFIGCVGSAFVEALLVFTVQLYLCITYFLNQDELQGRVGKGFELFVPVSDLTFIIFMAAIAALLLVALALLGHLLGFHIYLMCHKMTTYEFIVNARDDQRKRSSDVEAGASRSSVARKVKKNKVKPETRRESLENDRVELSEHERSVASSQVLHSETTVKIINEVSSKAAARHQSGTESPQEATQPSNSVELGALNSSHAAKETQSITSEESLKEICAPKASFVDTKASTVSAEKENSSPKGKNGDPDGSNDEELLPCTPGQKLKKNKNSSAVPDLKHAGNSKRNKNNDTAQGRDNKDSNETTPRKKKKKKPREATKKSEELPPLNLRSARPLPVLQVQNDNDDSVC